MRAFTILTVLLPFVAAVKVSTSSKSTSSKPTPTYCTSFANIVSLLSADASATPFCQSLLGLPHATSGTLTRTVTVVGTSTALTTYTTVDESSATTTILTSTLYTQAFTPITLGQAKVKARTNDMSTPSALVKRTDAIASRVCVCLNVGNPTTAIATVTSTVTSMTTIVSDVAATSTFDVTLTSTGLTTLYTATQTCDESTYYTPIANSGFDNGSLAPWIALENNLAAVFLDEPGYNSPYSVHMNFSCPNCAGQGGIAIGGVRQFLSPCLEVAYAVTFNYVLWLDTADKGNPVGCVINARAYGGYDYAREFIEVDNAKVGIWQPAVLSLITNDVYDHEQLNHVDIIATCTFNAFGDLWDAELWVDDIVATPLG